LFTGEERRLWVMPRVRSSSVVTEPLFWRLTRDLRTDAEVRKRVRQLGLTHQLHNVVSAAYRGCSWYPGPPWSPRQLRLYGRFARNYLKPVRLPERVDNQNGGFYLYEFAKKPAGAVFPLYCLPGTEGCFFHAFKLCDEGKPREAVRVAERTAAELRGVPQAEMLLAMIYHALRDGERLFRISEEANRNGFVGAGNFKANGQGALATGRIEAAVKAFCRSYKVGRDPGSLSMLSMALQARANRSMKKGEFERAFRDLDHAVSLSPHDPGPLFFAAMALERRGKREEALWYARRAGTLAPEDERVADLMERLRKAVEGGSARARP